MQHFDVNIRPIEGKDNAILAQLIRQSLEHYHLDLPGTSYTDPQLDHLFEHYQQQERSAYFVLAEGQQILGCGGYGQIQEGFPVAELQKLYLKQEALHQGLGRRLFDHICQAARLAGYQQLYLESSSKLTDALSFYQKIGFTTLTQPLAQMVGSHYTMDQWMILRL
nr:GNAT family N-acetyltransferase [Ignavigranum ruoffiae]